MKYKLQGSYISKGANIFSFPLHPIILLRPDHVVLTATVQCPPLLLNPYKEKLQVLGTVASNVFNLHTTVLNEL